MGPINHVHLILLLAALVSVYVMAEFYYDMKYGPQVDLKGVELHETPTGPTSTQETAAQETAAPGEEKGEGDLQENGEQDNDDDYDEGDDENDNGEDDNDEDENGDESQTSAKLSFSSNPQLSQSQSQFQSARPLIMYAYSETPNARSNLEFFLREGLHSGADFVFVVNGPAEEALRLIDSSANASTNVEVVQRPNTCYDLGAHGEVLRAGDRWRRYGRFVLLNASVRGPFVPYWSRACWSDAYLARVTDEVKLVGMTANCNPQFHIQSMIWATDAIGMELLLYPQAKPQRRRRQRRRRRDDESGGAETEEGVETGAEEEVDTDTDTPATAVEPGGGVALQGCYNERDRAIGAEVGTTAMIRAAGYEVDAMMAAFHKKPPAAASDNDYAAGCGVAEAEGGSAGDVLWNGAYFGSNVHPYETVFMKANRDIDPRTLELLTGWHLNGTMGRNGSWDVCS